MTTTTILADMAKNVGGNLVEVRSIVPAGVDIHSFQTTPSHSLAVGEAKLIVSNGLGLDDFLTSVLASAKQSSAVHVVASEGLAPAAVGEMELPGEQEEGGRSEDALMGEVDQLVHRIEEGKISAEEGMELMEQMLGGHQDEVGARAGEEHSEGEDSLEEELIGLVREVEDSHMTPESAIEAMEQLMREHEGGEHLAEHGHDHGAGDPHFWQDLTLAVHYVEHIRDGLMQADPANTEIYAGNAAEYTQKLRDLDQEIAQTLSQVPLERRHLVTFHDAFGYFGHRYGWQVSALVPSDASDVSPEAVVQVMERIRTEGIPAVFAEPQFNHDVLEQAARDTGVRVGTIYSDTINEEVPSYIEMMRFNARSLVENLE